MHITADLHLGPGLQRFTAQILLPAQVRGRRTVLGHGRSLVVYGLVVGQVQCFQILFGTFTKALPKGFMQRLKRNNPGRPNQRPDNRGVGDALMTRVFPGASPWVISGSPSKL